jgi:hypothetical protein
MTYRIVWDGPFTTVLESQLPADGLDVFEHFNDAKLAAAKHNGEQARLYRENARRLREMKLWQAKV